MLLAQIDTLLVAHRVTPQESVAVHLTGIVGPNGSYRLETVDVLQQPGLVVLVPRVRHTPGQMTIQILIPLERTVHLQLPAGRWVLEARGAHRTLTDSLVVEPTAQRPAPQTELHVRAPVETPALRVVPVEIVARTGDGFIDRIEVREWEGSEPGPWRAVTSVERQGADLRAWLDVPHARGGGHRLEARSVDGQGTPDPTPAIAVMP